MKLYPLNTNPYQITPLGIAQHEVAHAVMAKICRFPATRLTATGVGGCREGNGTRIQPDEAVLIVLAGVAWEAMEGLGPPLELIDFETTDACFSDITRAWKMSEESLALRAMPRFNRLGELKYSIATIQESIRYWISRATTQLKPYRALIARVGAILHQRHELSARQVAQLLRRVRPGILPDEDLRVPRRVRKATKVM